MHWLQQLFNLSTNYQSKCKLLLMQISISRSNKQTDKKCSFITARRDHQKRIQSSHIHVVVQVVSSKFRKYQMEIISESCYLLNQTSETSKGRKQGSYWKYAYRIAEIEHASERQEEESSLDHIENYWEKVLYQATRNWFLLFVTDLNFRGHILVLDREILENLERLYITEFHLWKLWQKLWKNHYLDNDVFLNSSPS